MFAKRGGNIVTVGEWAACLPVIPDWARGCVLKLLMVPSISATSFPWAPGWAVWTLERQTTVFSVSHTLLLPVSIYPCFVVMEDDISVGTVGRG